MGIVVKSPSYKRSQLSIKRTQVRTSTASGLNASVDEVPCSINIFNLTSINIIQ